jgi:hypothetical protein
MGSEGFIVAGSERRISASKLARDLGVGINDFTNEVVALLARTHGDTDSLRCGPGRREVCAAVSAAMVAALDASTLSDEERAKLRPLIDEVLLPFWTQHCAKDSGAGAYITGRSAHYLNGRVAGSRVKTAVNIVTALLDALAVPADRREELTIALAPSFAHRMVADCYRINEVRARFGIELSLIATLGALLQISVSCETVMRILRIG